MEYTLHQSIGYMQGQSGHFLAQRNSLGTSYEALRSLNLVLLVDPPADETNNLGRSASLTLGLALLGRVGPVIFGVYLVEKESGDLKVHAQVASL